LIIIILQNSSQNSSPFKNLNSEDHWSCRFTI